MLRPLLVKDPVGLAIKNLTVKIVEELIRESVVGKVLLATNVARKGITKMNAKIR